MFHKETLSAWPRQDSHWFKLQSILLWTLSPQSSRLEGNGSWSPCLQFLHSSRPEAIARDQQSIPLSAFVRPQRSYIWGAPQRFSSREWIAENTVCCQNWISLAIRLLLPIWGHCTHRERPHDSDWIVCSRQVPLSEWPTVVLHNI